MARLAGPIIERHVRAVAVVGLEGLPHDLKEVAQATGAQRMPRCGTGVSLAEQIVIDVRMRDLDGGYASLFNQRHDREGPLYQSRFKSVLVENDSHSWELSSSFALFRE